MHQGADWKRDTILDGKVDDRCSPEDLALAALHG
jgi:hypothetical protein